MTAPVRILTCDGMSARFASVAAFMEDIVSHMNDAWARRGVAGCDIVCAEWDHARQVIFLDTIPGAEALTVRRVRAHLDAERAKGAERMRDGMARLL